MSNFGSFSYFQTSLSLGVGQVLQKLPKFDINDLKLLFHCFILIPRKCPHKIPFKTQKSRKICQHHKFLNCTGHRRLTNIFSLLRDISKRAYSKSGDAPPSRLLNFQGACGMATGEVKKPLIF